jgi:hypothetical protein
MTNHPPLCGCLACATRRESRLRDDLARAFQEADEMLAVLCKVEWGNVYDDGTETCPVCGALAAHGHKEDCRLAAVLKRRRVA